MNDFLTTAVSGITITTISALIVLVISKSAKFFWSQYEYAIKSYTARTMNKMPAVLSRLINWTIDFGLMFFFLYQVKNAASAPQPLQGWDVVGIAFWTWWAMFWALRMTGAIVVQKRPQEARRD